MFVSLAHRVLFSLWVMDGRRKLRHMQPHLGRQARIVDIGCGAGSVTMLLRAQGHAVTPVDVRARALTATVTPVLFDGRRLPFGAAAFDAALLLTVLHHASDPDSLIAEAARVSRRVLVIEDTYGNRAQRALTLATDSLVNGEFRGHPHNNRSDTEWRRTFARLQLHVLHVESWRVAVFYRQSLYVLQPEAHR